MFSAPLARCPPFVGALLLVVLSCSPCSREPAPQRRTSLSVTAHSALLITLDTVRADRIGAYGHERARTPVLDSLVRRGLLFERAYSPVPITLPAHTSILTGLDPPAHGVRDNGSFRLTEDAELLPERLLPSGFRSAAFVGSFVLDAKFGLDQGFESYRGPSLHGAGLSPEIVERPADQVIDDALEWLSELEPSERFFAWVHLYDAHTPYRPPERWMASGIDPYDGEIAFCDEQIGRLLEGIEGHGLQNGLLIVVTADHGEALGAHGERTHGIFLYEETMRVPLILAWEGRPAEIPMPARVLRPVSLVDVAPALLAALGVSIEGDGTAPSLWDDVSATGPARSIYLESFLPFYSFRWRPLLGLVNGDLKWIAAGTDELYDLSSDPTESVNLAIVETGRAAEMREVLERRTIPRKSLADRLVVDEEERQKLERLGYVIATFTEPPDFTGLPDPRERIGDLDLRERAKVLLQEGRELLGQDEILRDGKVPEAVRDPGRRAQGRARLDEARSLLEQLRVNHPLDPSVDEAIGTVEIARGDFAAAVEPLERALVSNTGQTSARYNLAIAYLNTGRRDFARLEMQKLLTVEPRFVLAFRFLVQLHGEGGELGRALWWMQRLEGVLEDAPAELLDVRTRIERMKQRNVQPEPAPDFPTPDLIPEGKE